MSQNNNDLLETTLLGFTDMVNQFLEALAEVWPECSGIKDYILKIDLAINNAIDAGAKRKAMESLIQRYHNSVKPIYGRCANRDPTVFTECNIEFLQPIGLREKWLSESIDDDCRDCIWEYVLEMNRYSQLYEGLFRKIPTNTLNKIQSTAVGLANKIQNGEMTLADLDLNQLGKDVVDGLDQAEIEQFTSNIMQDPAVLQNLCANMMGGTGMDMNAMMGMVNQQNPQAAAALAALQMMQGGFAQQ
jgi:hypothetical protein